MRDEPVTYGSPTGTGSPATVVMLAATLGLAAACWVVSLWQMNGMDMGVATRLGSFALFARSGCR
jgi:hypothetical protein